MKNQIKYLFRQISVEVFAVLLLFIISLLVFSYIADENVLENNKVFDAKVMAYVAAHSTPLRARNWTTPRPGASGSAPTTSSA